VDAIHERQSHGRGANVPGAAPAHEGAWHGGGGQHRLRRGETARAGTARVRPVQDGHFASDRRFRAGLDRLFSRPGGIADQIAEQFGLYREAAVQKFLEDRYMANAVVFLASPLATFITANLDLGGTLRGML
jgi:hypothetical protein